MNAFLTGSHAYGRPSPESDIDIAILVERSTLEKLEQVFGGDGRIVQYGLSVGSFRHEKINLIAFTEEWRFDAWRSATESLTKTAPVSREQAVALIQATVAMAEPKEVATP